MSLEHWSELKRVDALPLNFDQSAAFKPKSKEERLSEEVDKFARQPYLSIEDGLFILNGNTFSWVKSSNSGSLMPVFKNRLMFWLERKLRNEIVNVYDDKFFLAKQVDKEEWLQQYFNFYKDVFVEGKPKELLLHQMINSNEFTSHNHQTEDVKIIIQAEIT